MTQQPNIVICMCDQLRAFEVGCYGHPVVRTPHIDALAAQGVRFTTAVSNNPVCMPARSIVLSGQHSRTCTGLVRNATRRFADGGVLMPEYPEANRPHLPDTTIAEALAARGYRTAAIGKWHVHAWPQDLGFEHYLIPRVHHCHWNQLFTDGQREFASPGFSVDFEAQKVDEYLGQAAGSGEPFFLYYNISPPHMPVMDLPDQYLRMYDPDQVQLRPNVPAEDALKDRDAWYRIYAWDYRYYDLKLPYTLDLPDGFSLRNLTALYYGATSWVDDTVGRLVAALQQHGLADNTIVVFTSDHGDNLGSHGLFNKSQLFEESIRVPMIVRWPAMLQPRTVDGDVASLIDLMPTLLDLAGCPVPGSCQGESLAPLLRDADAHLDRPGAFIETNTRFIGLRTTSHLLGLELDRDAQLLNHSPRWLFDLHDDPYQLRNRADDRAAVAEHTRNLEALRQWHRTTGWLGGRPAERLG